MIEKTIGLLKVAIGLVIMGVGVAITIAFLVLFLPWPGLRARTCNVFGKTVGPMLMWLTGCPVTVKGREHLRADRPAIYVTNHTSIIDIFIAIWLSPMGTVGVAKKEVIYYPFFGQLYLLSANLRIDRGNTASALSAMRRLVSFVRRYRISIYIWPEGTRSKDGRLQRLKKGFVHLALQTGLPVVPIVVTGAHKSWRKNSIIVYSTPVDIEVLPAIETTGWSTETVEDHVQEVWQRFYDHLPEEQRPLPESAAAK